MKTTISLIGLITLSGCTGLKSPDGWEYKNGLFNKQFSELTIVKEVNGVNWNYCAMNIELIAQMCHEVNRAWCSINNDSTQKSWSEAEQWQRDSAIKGVQFALDNPNATPESQHEAWYKDKEKDGWMFGFVKDPVKKEHPCCFREVGKYPQDQRDRQGSGTVFRKDIRSAWR